MERQILCPCCPNHCSKNELRCKRGEAYFSGNDHAHPVAHTTEEKIIVQFRKFGHYLHHFSDAQPAKKMLANLSDEEKEDLLSLLVKIDE